MENVVYFIRRLPRLMFNLLMNFTSSFYVVAVFLIKEKVIFSFLPLEWVNISYIVYLIIPIITARFCIWLSAYLPKCGMECQIEGVELASHSFLPNYLGYFFVALSIPDFTVLIFVYLMIFIFTHISQALSFNPMFLLYGYHFYFVTSKDGTRIFLVSRQKMKPYQDAELTDLRRINDFTFIDMR